MLEKILGLISIGQALSGMEMARKFVVDLVALIALTVIASVIAGALLTFGLFECHEILMRQGVDPDLAAALSGLIGLLLLIGLICLIRNKLTAMRRMPSSFARVSAVGTSAATVLNAFYRGLSGKK